MKGGVGGSPGGWMRGNEEEAVNFTLKLWGASSECDEDWNGGGGWRVSGPLSTERWRLNQRAGVCQRGCVLLRRRKDGEDSSPEEDSCWDFTSSSSASEPGCFFLLFSPSAAASWVRTAGLLVRMCFLLIGVVLQDNGCFHQTGINY